MKTAKEWALLVDTHMPDDVERFEAWIRAIQADALEAASGVIECGHACHSCPCVLRQRERIRKLEEVAT